MATQYTLTDSFTAITESKGTVQNFGKESVELVSTTNATAGEGIVLLPGEKRTFNGNLSARAMGDNGAEINVVDFTEAGEGGGGSSYTLPEATASTLGGVKIGNNISVASDGTISLGQSDVTGALGYTPPQTDTTYSDATQSAAGLMSTSDKTKLDGIASGANNYTLPVATAGALGGVKSSSASDGVTVNNDGTMTVNGGGAYTLPTASASTLGGIKVGDRLSIDANGVLSAADQSYTLPTASASTLGGVKSSTADGKISVDSTGVMTYNEPTPTVEPIVAPAWESGTSYPQNALVSNNSNVYIALVAHTAGADFATDLAAGKWHLVGASSSAVNNGGYIQSTQLGIVGSSATPADVFLPINTTTNFCLPPVDVLEIVQGSQDQDIVTNTMSSGDAASFNFDNDFVHFNGVIEMITSYPLTMSSSAALGDGYISESNVIDPADYAAIEEVLIA